MLLDHKANGKKPYASFKVPPEFKPFADFKKKVKGELVYYREYDGEINFISAPDDCKPLQKMKYGINQPDIRCSYLIFSYVRQPRKNDSWLKGSSVEQYLKEEADYFRNHDNSKTGAIADSRPYRVESGLAQEFLRFSQYTKDMFGQGLTREVIFFPSKEGRVKKVLHMGYVEQNWSKEKEFTSRSDWKNEEVFERILSTVEFYK